jgi:hypothetical protein
MPSKSYHHLCVLVLQLYKPPKPEAEMVRLGIPIGMELTKTGQDSKHGML